MNRLGPFTIDLRKLSRALRAWGDEAVRATAGAIQVEHERIMTAAKARVPVDLGTLRASGHVWPTVREGRRLVSRGGFGGPAAPYAVVVHEGRHAHTTMPPVEAIRRWAVRHGMPEEAAYPIARAIAARGLEGFKFYESPFLSAQAGMAERIATRVRARLSR